MMNIAKDKQKDILFVSDDRKSDWCDKFHEYDLGPRKELIKEFFDETNQKFHTITTQKFINYISGLHTIEDTKELERESVVIEKDLLNSNLDDEELSNLNYFYPAIENALKIANRVKLSPAIVNAYKIANKFQLDPALINALEIINQSSKPVGNEVTIMVSWFKQHYEDPANGVPYDGKEGGYL